MKTAVIQMVHIFKLFPIMYVVLCVQVHPYKYGRIKWRQTYGRAEFSDLSAGLFRVIL